MVAWRPAKSEPWSSVAALADLTLRNGGDGGRTERDERCKNVRLTSRTLPSFFFVIISARERNEPGTCCTRRGHLGCKRREVSGCSLYLQDSYSSCGTREETPTCEMMW